MSDKTGKLYTDAKIAHTAKVRAEEDNKHESVFWECVCGHRSISNVKVHKIHNRQCPECSIYMQWSYRPFAAVA